MEDSDLLQKVKDGMSINHDYNNNNLLIKILAVKEYMLGMGIKEEQIESNLGISTLIVGVNDLWNMESGEIKFSPAFNQLVFRLQVVSQNV